LDKVENAAPRSAAPMAFPASAPSAPVADSEAAGMAARSAKFSEPATTPDAAIERIRRELRESQRAAALRDLVEFRKRYPDYRLPEDLRALR
jgi:hypothetical protein